MPAVKILRVIALLSASAVLAPALPASAAEEKPAEATVSVSGEGHASVAPDMAIVTLSVVKQSKTAQDALAQNNKAMGAVLETLKNTGIAERDLQTSGFSIQPQYNYGEKNDKPPELVGYQATNTLTVRVRDISKLGALLDQVVNLGINQGGDIQFTNDKPDQTIATARKLAVDDAATKAKQLADAAGVKLGRVISIQEGGDRSPPVAPMPMRAMKANADVPIANGENDYNVSVNITYAITQ